jgi:hypothetical protein
LDVHRRRGSDEIEPMTVIKINAITAPEGAGADKPSPHGGPVSVWSKLWSYEVTGGSPG